MYIIWGVDSKAYSGILNKNNYVTIYDTWRALEITDV